MGCLQETAVGCLSWEKREEMLGRKRGEKANAGGTGNYMMPEGVPHEGFRAKKRPKPSEGRNGRYRLRKKKEEG